MALAVESTSTSTSTSKTVTITKPTGVAEGDLLLIIAPTGGLSSTVTSSGFTQAYEFDYEGPGAISDTTLFVLYKVATAADVSATNYTVTWSDFTGSIAAMFRISGWASVNPVYQSSAGGFNNSTSGTFSQTGLTLSRLSQQVAIMVLCSYDDGDGDYYKTASSRTITSSDSNPTWTEVCDIGPVTNSANGLSALTLNVAYATTSLSSDVTGFSFGYLEFDADEGAGGIGALLLLEAPADATGTNALLSVSPTIFTNAGVEAGTTGTNATFEVSPTIPTQSGRATSPTPWTNEAKPSTNWVNEQK